MAFRPFITNLLGLDGTPESGGLLQSYVKDTTTPLPLYSDAGVTPRTNPIVAESLGQVTAYFNDALSYSWQAKTADNATTLWRADVVAGVLTLTFVNPDYDVFPIVDLAAVRSTSTYAALTGLMAATGLIDGAVYVTKARSSADDGGHGQWRYDAASVATADGGTVLAKDGGGAGRFFRLWNGSVDPRWFGASSSALAAANTTAFGSIPRGSIVDLQGLTYTVTDAAAIIFDLHLINGALKVGSVRYPMPRNPMAHPLASSEPKIIEDGTQVHYWPGPVANFSGTLVGCWADSQRHETQPGSPLMFERSKDGVTWQDAVVVYANNSYDPRPLVGAKLSASRFGVLFCEVDGSGNINATKFSYTDNPTAQSPTFTTVDVGTVLAYFHPEPLVEGNTVHFFGYGGAPDIDIYRLTSTNLGAAGTWTMTKIIEGSTSAITKPVEPAVVKIDTSKYLMIVRDDDGGNAHASTSTDLSTWTALIDTGIGLGLNPPAAIVTWGKLWFYAAARGDDIEGLTDTLIVYEADADAVYAAGGVFSPVPAPRIAMKGKPSMIGYMSVAEIDPSVWMGFMIDGEEDLGSANPTSARLIRLGGYDVPSQVNLVHRRRPPITKANTPIWWPYGNPTGITSRGKGWAGSWIASSTDSISATRTQLDDALRGTIPWTPPYAARLQSAAGGSGRTIYCNRIYGRENIAAWLDKVVTGNFAGYGTLPGYYFFRIRLDFGTGGSPSTAIVVDSETAAISAFATGHKVVSVVSYTPRVTSSHVWGSNDDCWLDFRFISNDAGAADFYLTGRWVDLGNEYVPLDPEGIDEVRESLKQITEVVQYSASQLIGLGSFGSTSSGVIPVTCSRKRVIPAVSIANGFAAGDVQQDGGPDVQSTATTFDKIGVTGARMALASAAAFASGSDKEIEAGSNGFEILFEAAT